MVSVIDIADGEFFVHKFLALPFCDFNRQLNNTTTFFRIMLVQCLAFRPLMILTNEVSPTLRLLTKYLGFVARLSWLSSFCTKVELLLLQHIEPKVLSTTHNCDGVSCDRSQCFHSHTGNGGLWWCLNNNLCQIIDRELPLT